MLRISVNPQSKTATTIVVAVAPNFEQCQGLEKNCDQQPQ